MGISLETKSLSLTTHRRLGDVLVEMGVLSEEQIEALIQKAGLKRQRLTDILLQEGALSPADLARALAAQYDTEYVDLDQIQVNPEATKLIPEAIVRNFSVLPIDVKDNLLVIVTHDPIQILKLENLKSQLPANLDVKVCVKSKMDEVINRLYKNDHAVDRIVKHLSKKQVAKKGSSATLSPAGASQKDSGPSIEALVNRFLERAMNDRASDIHIDPSEEKVRVRVRIDGILHELYTYPPELHPSVSSRIKVLSNLDISERRQPQDGGFRHQKGSNPIEVRVSTLPTAFGEKIVLRLLDRSMTKGSLAQIGMSPEIETAILTLLRRPYGIVFITGPTGSGKTTTLYSMLNQIDCIEKNVITVEDPIEFRFDMINQVQVNEKAGLTFAGLLRNILRQDPDVVMIGEVRDQETADLSVRAALTGHLVLSTIHTNDSVSAPTRLIDMGVEPFLLASGLSAVIAQRLVRVLCLHCRKKTALSQEDAALLGTTALAPGTVIYEPEGCDKCLHSGYQNRTALFELMIIDDFVRRAIVERKPEDEIYQYLRKSGFISMRQDGIFKIASGVTSVEEVLKATL
ncbi:MAG: type II/IV secretion system protein [Proteobacteria bacterium]|nr:type II/IV secretion system protein [Pseudomonadota bacterium]